MLSSPYAAEKSFSASSDQTRFNVGQPIITGSERVVRNDSLLTSGSDYQVRGGEGEIVLAEPLHEGDSLRISYSPIPIWLRQFGRSIPSATQSVTRPEARGLTQSTSMARERTDILIYGAKSFRVTSRTSGPADFSQTLDLKISGELAPGLFIEGNVTDRDLDPVYSTLNSRLSELDRMNIRVYSENFEGELGDLTPGRRPGLSRAQQMTGLGFSVTEANWDINGTLARPRGEYVTVSLLGQDALQGPYRVNSSGRAYPVVPGSETVWLDGSKLDRGTDKDYQIDYTLGEVSFNVNYPIDSRSRIEVDFEPQTTTFKKELYAGGGTVHADDSLAYFGFQVIREGDDSGERLLGELTEAETSLLSQSGDSLVWTSGVIADTSGDYLLIVDSLPDSVYRWVETGGEYAISFSYVGPSQGEYRLLGNGVYEYVGPGAGEYLPLRQLTAPQRTSYYQLTTGTQNGLTGALQLSWKISSYDKNLFSTLDDQDNHGNLIELSNMRRWSRRGEAEQLQLSYRLLEPEYRARDRIYQPEFKRTYSVPDNFTRDTNERLLQSSIRLAPMTHNRVDFSFNQLDYQDRFQSNLARAALLTDWSERLQSEFAYENGSSSLDTGETGLEGKRYNLQTKLAYQALSLWHMSGKYERDSRKNEYSGEMRGTRYQKLTFESGLKAEALSYEYYLEDSLTGDWSRALKRHRVSLQSSRQLDRLRYNLTVTRQWLDRIGSQETGFLGRLNLRYDDPSNRLTGTASYLISDEQKNQRGITYFRVAPGEGDYILDESAPGGPQYIPDEQGDYIRLEEQLSERSAIRRGERSFLFSKGGDGWQVRFDSRHDEELLAGGERPWWWAVPFLTDESADYLYFLGRHNADMRLIDLGGFYLLNLSGSRQKEARMIGHESPAKLSTNLEMALKERVSALYLEQSVSLFRSDRDQYYSGIGEVNGYKGRLGARRSLASGEVGMGVSRREATSDSDEKVVTHLLDLSGRVPLFARGKLRTEIEWYRHQFRNLIGPASYQLTDNRPGSEGAVWSLSLQYGLNRDLRGNFTLSGRHSDDRRGRIMARGELIASF